MPTVALALMLSAATAQPIVNESIQAQHKPVTIYQVTLDQPITLPQCTEQMYWHQNGKEMCLHMDNIRYQPPMVYTGTVAYPKHMQPPKLMGVAFDENQLPVVLGVITELEDQKKVFSLLEEQLGEPLIVITKDPSQEGNIPKGIPSTLWYQARGGSKIAVWDNGYAWAFFVSDRGFTDGSGKLQIGLKRLLPEGKLPEHDWLLN